MRVAVSRLKPAPDFLLVDAVSIDLSPILEPGDAFEIRDAQNYFGPPVASGTYAGKSVEIPMGGTAVAAPVGTPVKPYVHTPKEFGAFVVRRVP